MRGQQKRELFTWESIELMVAIGWGLGLVFGAGVAVVFMAPSWLNFALLGISMSVFHMWEWLFVALKRPHDLSGHSFLLDHSTEYTIAWGFCITEYLVERYFFPGLKQHTNLTLLGFSIVAAGQFLRTLSMATAGANFNHCIEEDKRDDHKLVTTGIYGVLRHPSYMGWFWWCVAMQIMLANPISSLAFAVVAWKFFSERIQYEEQTLIEQFGNAYQEYRKKTRTGIPFIA